jgi:hypothetical protein
MLTNAAAVEVIGSAPTLPLLKTQRPEAVIVADVDEIPAATISQFLAIYPDLPIICADLNTNEIRVITSHRVTVRSDDLPKAIRRLPSRRKGG